MAKRLFDLLLAIAIAPFAIPLVMLAAIAIRLESPGPALFLQPRVGRDRKLFTIMKLRTMRDGTRQGGTHEIGDKDITRVGHFLRRTKLDELPQLVNVIRGEMSFVGPRPCLPMQQDLIAERDQRGVFAIRPGITGPAQIAGVDMSDPERLAQIEAKYVDDHGLVGDVSLIVLTAIGRGYGDAAR